MINTEQINNFPECQKCRLLQGLVAELADNPNLKGKDVYITRCNWKFSFVQSRASIVAMVIDEGRLEQLKKMKKEGEGVEFMAGAIFSRYPGACEHKVQQSVEAVFKFLRLPTDRLTS
jgi:hypothetical protein